MQEQTSCRGGCRGPGNGGFTPRWWSRFGEFLVRHRWICLWLIRHRTVPSGTLWLIQLRWGRGFEASAPGSSRESAPGRGPAVASSPVLAGPSMVLRPDFSPRRLSMGDSSQEGSPFTSGGYDLSPPPGVMYAVDVVPEGAQLIASGFSTEVVETILQSRAPSTRKLYGLKWRLFTSWCGDHQVDPVNCPVGTVLEILQARFSAWLSHSTLRVYVAAIERPTTPLWVDSQWAKTPWLHVFSTVWWVSSLQGAQPGKA